MGKKTNRGKDKKQKRLQQFRKEDAETAAQQAVVDAANAVDDPMAQLQAFKKFDRNGLNLSIGCHRVKDLSSEMINWIFDITRSNMQKLYEDAGWGWNDKEKRTEMTEDAAWHMIARDVQNENKPVAYLHFRFDLDEGDIVLYCYEIQLVKEVRRKGLGKFMMQTLELMAYRTDMEKVMLTVFKENTEGQQFFMKTLKYTVDETSPEETMEEAMFDEDGYTYTILSKKIAAKKSTKPLTQNSVNTAQASTVS